MAKGSSFTTYLVAVKQKREPTRVYALLASSADEALAIVSAQMSDNVAVEVVGQLSGRMARPYKLQPGDLVLI